MLPFWLVRQISLDRLISCYYHCFSEMNHIYIYFSYVQLYFPRYVFCYISPLKFSRRIIIPCGFHSIMFTLHTDIILALLRWRGPTDRASSPPAAWGRRHGLRDDRELVSRCAAPRRFDVYLSFSRKHHVLTRPTSMSCPSSFLGW